MIKYISTLSIIAFLVACKAVPIQTVSYQNFEKIITDFGTEDVQLDSSCSAPRLLISCDERRALETQGSIWSYDLETQKTEKLKIDFRYYKSEFHPHGISSFRAVLFVVNHSTKKESEILRFSISTDGLKLDTVYKHKAIDFPNDIFAVNENEFYATNYHYLNGALTHYKNNEFTKIDKGMSLPNGVIKIDDKIIVSTTFSNKIISYDINNNYKREKLFKIKGGDNFSTSNNKLYVSSHPKFAKFFKHYKDAENISPSVIYELDLITKEEKVIYSNTTGQINAASGGLFYKNKLYISQVFENFILIATPLQKD